MANFYAEIKNLINDCDISFIEPLSYMKHFSTAQNASASGASEKVVLLYKKGSPSKSPPQPLRSKFTKKEPGSDEENDSNLLNLTGSPLKDSCQFDLLNLSITDDLLPKKNAWNDDEEKYHSIAMDEAQVHFNTILCNFKGENFPKCWAICDGNDSNTLLLSIEKIEANKYCRGILKFNGIVDFQPINMAELQAKHLSYVVKQYGPLEGVVDSYYRLGNDVLLQVSHLVNGSMPQSILADGKMASKMILHQSIAINNFRSIAHKFWIQLGILNDIKETILSYKEFRDSSALTFHSLNKSDIGDIKKEIYDMLTQPIPIGVTDEDDMNNRKPNTNIEQIVENAGNRVSVELTDQLWDLLKTCSSYDTLKEAIEFIFTSAAKINVVNMPSSQSRLAQLIRDVSDHRIAIPRLSGSEPLELLLEIGLEKMNKNYEFIFMESKLCTADELRADKRLMMAGGDLNVRKSLKTQFSSNGTVAAAAAATGTATTNGIPRKTLMHKQSEGAMELNDSKEMVGFQNSQFNLKQIDANLARLGRIHLILEHLITIKINLNLENVFTTFLDDLHKPLIPFKVLKEMQSDFRAIPVSNTKILAKIGNIPNRLRVSIKSRNQFKIYRNTFYYATEPIFPPHVFKSIEHNNDTKSNVFYSHQYLEIENV